MSQRQCLSNYGQSSHPTDPSNKEKEPGGFQQSCNTNTNTTALANWNHFSSKQLIQKNTNSWCLLLIARCGFVKTPDFTDQDINSNKTPLNCWHSSSKDNIEWDITTVHVFSHLWGAALRKNCPPVHLTDNAWVIMTRTHVWQQRDIQPSHKNKFHDGFK